MEFLLLIALAGLLLLHMRLSARVRLLEEMLHGSEAAPEAERPRDPLFERPATIAPSARDAPAEERRASGTFEPIAPPEEVLPAGPAPARETFATLFERFVGGRLLIWIGGIALAVAGFFLVRYSIGLITPPVRMMAAAAFGLLLIAAGELSRNRSGALGDARVAQALVGAGILVLYAAAYGALILFNLISLGTASALMVAITAAALLLSLRHGAPTAAMGLAGGFATPLLVGDPDAGAVPLLGYLVLLDLALFAIAQRRGWTWLAAAAVLLSFAWTASLLVRPEGDALAGGAFIAAFGFAASLPREAKGWRLGFLRPAAIGLVQLAILVARPDLGLPAWGLFGLLSAATLFLAARRPEYRLLPPLALLIALLLLGLKAMGGADPHVVPAAAGITALFAGFALTRVVKGPDGLLWTWTAAAAFAAPPLILRLLRPELLDRPSWGVLLLAAAAGPLLLAFLRLKPRDPDRLDRPLFAASAAAMLLLGAGLFDLAPARQVGTAWLLVALAAAYAAARLKDAGLALLALCSAAVAALWTLSMMLGLWITLAGSLVAIPALATSLPSAGEALQVLILPALLLLLLWRALPDHSPRPRTAVFAGAGLFLTAAAYVFAKQLFALASYEDFVARGFAERMLITQALFVAGWLLAARRLRLPWIDKTLAVRSGAFLTAVAAARLLWFDLLIHNPVTVSQNVGTMPFLNLLLPAYLLSALWLYGWRRRGADHAERGAWLALSLASLVVGSMLMVRQLFQGADLTVPQLSSSESYAYSLVGLLLSVAMLLLGVRLPDKALRLAGLAFLTATIVKVFLIDAAVLDGVLRILSFLGLGIALIGMGKLYGTVLRTERGRTGS
jgi:uncharacterized membrane protein